MKYSITLHRTTGGSWTVVLAWRSPLAWEILMTFWFVTACKVSINLMDIFWIYRKCGTNLEWHGARLPRASQHGRCIRWHCEPCDLLFLYSFLCVEPHPLKFVCVLKVGLEVSLMATWDGVWAMTDRLRPGCGRRLTWFYFPEVEWSASFNSF